MRVIDIRDCVIVPTLISLSDWQPAIKSESAINLLLGIGAVESRYYYLKQYPHGPARGFWQVEPATESDNWDNYLAYRSKAASIVRGLAEQHDQNLTRSLTTSLRYNCAHARIKLWRVRDPLPPAHDVHGMAEYWRKYYNAADSDFDDDVLRFKRAYRALVESVGANV